MESFRLRCKNRSIGSIRISERMVSASPGFTIPLLLAAPRPLIKGQTETDPSGFLIIDIPRFPEPAHPREDTDPATAERLGLDRRQMRDTIAYSDGKGYMDLISLSSRRRGRHIAQMPPVRAGGRNNSSHFFYAYFNQV